jgi:lipopolysaccharide transport protein LptA
VAVDPATGEGALDVTSGSAGFARRDRYVRFEGAVRLVRDRTVLSADTAIGYLAADEDRLELLELRGQSSVTSGAAAPGGLESMTARDINLAYAPDGRSLKQATLAGDGVIQMAGPAGQRGRRLAANWIDLIFAPDGTTVTTLSAREGVDLQIPGAGAGAADRRIRSTALEGTGREGQGLSSVRFSENVEFRELRPASGERPAIDRVARSRTLDVETEPGLGGLERASFAGGVTFRDGDTQARAPTAVYDLAQGTLALAAGGAVRASVDDPRVNVEARTIDLTVDSDALIADGDVRSLLKAGGQATAGRRRPALLREDQPVNVTARHLAYDSAAGTAVYTGDARLWQGETAVQAATITIDDRSGNLTATTGVRSSLRLDDTDPKSGRVERKTTIATAESLVYEEAAHRATYTKDARMNGPEGDLRAARIELYLKPEGGALDRLQAYENVVLRSADRTSSGAQLTYYAADARYVMTGTPVRVLEQLPSECRETVGRILTFFRATDTILVDGNEQGRTQTTSGGKCPGPPGE